MTSGSKRIKQHLEIVGHITGLEALANFGIYRLASIIQRLRDKGMNIETEMVNHPTKKGCKFANYIYKG